MDTKLQRDPMVPSMLLRVVAAGPQSRLHLKELEFDGAPAPVLEIGSAWPADQATALLEQLSFGEVEGLALRLSIGGPTRIHGLQAHRKGGPLIHQLRDAPLELEGMEVEGPEGALIRADQRPQTR